jgi:hypothetical protein
MQAIIKVLVFPPRESFKSRVSLESRYGTKEPEGLDLSDRMLMQFPSANKLLLILAPSIIL